MATSTTTSRRPAARKAAAQPRAMLKQALAEGRPQIGLWLGLADAYCAEILAGAAVLAVAAGFASASFHVRCTVPPRPPVGAVLSTPRMLMLYFTAGMPTCPHARRMRWWFTRHPA